MAIKTTTKKTSTSATETKAVSTKVLLVTSTFAAEGTIRHPSRQNIPNLFNNGLTVGTGKNTGQVVPLSNVRVLLATGEEERKRSMRVKKPEVILVAEIGNGQPQTSRKATATASRKRHNKELVSVKVGTSSYNLVGKMDAGIRALWTDSPDDIDSFISLTEAEIAPKLLNGAGQFHSMMVAKAHITSLADLRIVPPEVEMTLVRITRYAEKMEASLPGDLPDLESAMPDAQVHDA